MDLKTIAYLAYLLISIGLTIWVAKVLFKNGRVFLIDVFKGNNTLTDAVNKLLLVGFYLINFGYIALTLKSSALINGNAQLVEFLSSKVGIIVLVLGAMHFGNLFIFFRLRKRAKEEDSYPDYTYAQ